MVVLTGKRALQATLLLAVFGMVVVALHAQSRVRGGTDWQYLGQAQADGKADHDKIDVGTSGFSQLAIEVRGGAIMFDRMVIHFGNGSTEALPINERVASGARSQAIDMPATDREIKSVEIWYAKGNYAEGTPTVQLFGRR
jgi:hypothetical protein